MTSALSEPARRRALGSVLAIAAASLWGTWSLWLRPTGLPGTVTAPAVFVLIGASALPSMWIERRSRPRAFDAAVVRAIVGYALLDALNVVTFFSAMSTTTVAIAVLTHSVAPLLVALASERVDGVKVPRASSSALLGLAGLVVILEPWRELGGLGTRDLAGAALGLVSAFAYAGNVFFGRRASEAVGPATTLGLHAWLAALLIAPFALHDLSTLDLVVPPWEALGWLAIAGLGPGLVAGIAFLRATSLIGSARATILAFFEPVVACAVGVIMFDEPLSVATVLGALAVVIAGVRVTQPPKEAGAPPAVLRTPSSS